VTVAGPKVSEQVIRAVVERLAAEYAPQQVILFGSYADGSADECSDLDLFIVKETGGSFFDRWEEVARVLEAVPGCPPVQPYVLTPAQVEARLRLGDHFVEDILDRGKVLYGCATYRRPIRTRTMDISYAEEWLQRADRDLDRVYRLLDDGDTGAAFHLQQAVEKHLKAYLIAHGWRLARTHDLGGLLDEGARHSPRFEVYRAVAQTVGKFYIAERYPLEPGQPDPLDGRPLTVEWIQECLDAVMPMLDLIRQSMAALRETHRENPHGQ
jgi:HEPN domain-containing protein/predicted nucleotidyltransferase